MDHLLFLFREHLETTQISLRSFSEQFINRIGSFREKTSNFLDNATENLRNRDISLRYHNILRELKEKIKFIIKTADVLCRRGVLFFLQEVTRSHLYFGALCLAFGSLIGVYIGLRIRHMVVSPQRMRAVVATSYKGLESIATVEDLLAPKIFLPDQVLVQVKSGAVDYLDIKISEGYGNVYRRYINKYNINDWGDLPVVLGRSCSGVVVSVGMNVNKVEQGDEVWLAVPVHHQGTLSEFIAVSESLISLKPPNLNFDHAASLPYDVVRAWDLLVCQAGLDEASTDGKRVLVHAGASGISTIVIQLVKAWGGIVTTTVTSSSYSLANALGADDVITYDTTDFRKELLLRERYDVIINPLGWIFSEDSLVPLLVPGGILVTSSHPTYASDSYGVLMGCIYYFYLRFKFCFSRAPWVSGEHLGSMEVSGEVLDRVCPLISSGKLRPVVNKVFSCYDAESAFRLVTKNDTVGKVVIRFSGLNSNSRNLEAAFWQYH